LGTQHFNQIYENNDYQANPRLDMIIKDMKKLLSS